MSLQINDTTNFKGIAQIYEKECGFNRGDITGDTNRLKDFIADVNLALDDFFALAITASGEWQLDDSNQTSYPIITTNIVSGQRDYSFTSDTDGNLILDIYKVAVLPSATSTLYQELDPIDVQQDRNSNMLVGNDTAGIPYLYDKTANGILLSPVPNYSVSAGLKVYVNREASYFTYTDTTKKPGVPGIFHKYFALKPALDYARRFSLTNYNAIAIEVQKMEKQIKDYFGGRDKDVHKVLRGKKIKYI